jgi:hypothetical protein
MRNQFAARGAAFAAAIALVGALVAGCGSSSLSDGTPCEDFAKGDSGQQSDYLASKLEDINGGEPSSKEVVAYSEGVRLNCSKGYGETLAESVERTDSEVEEAAAEGGSLQDGISLIRERTEEREAFGEVNGELEEEERLLKEREGY